MDEAIAEIRSWHRRRCFAMEQRKRANLALGAFIRTMLGWSRLLPEAERKKIATRAAAIVKKPDGSEWADIIMASQIAQAPFVAEEKKALKEMERLAQALPVWESFGKELRGFGAASLAVIVAEAGNLSNYPDPAKLRKRMGVAVIDGFAQGKLPKGTAAEIWIEHGYNKQRRSRLWNIGDALIKGNRDGAYRRCYLDRKSFEAARDPTMTKMKAHRRAQRYMEQRLLKHLWQAWRRTIGRLPSNGPKLACPPPTQEAA